jgi:hypothetical protein
MNAIMLKGENGDKVVPNYDQHASQRTKPHQGIEKLAILVSLRLPILLFPVARQSNYSPYEKCEQSNPKQDVKPPPWRFQRLNMEDAFVKENDNELIEITNAREKKCSKASYPKTSIMFGG